MYGSSSPSPATGRAIRFCFSRRLSVVLWAIENSQERKRSPFSSELIDHIRRLVGVPHHPVNEVVDSVEIAVVEFGHSVSIAGRGTGHEGGFLCCRHVRGHMPSPLSR